MASQRPACMASASRFAPAAAARKTGSRLGEGAPQRDRIELARGEHRQHAERQQHGPARHPGELDAAGTLLRLERVHRHELEAGCAPAPGDLGDGRRGLVARAESSAGTFRSRRGGAGSRRRAGRAQARSAMASAPGRSVSQTPRVQPTSVRPRRRRARADERPLEPVRRAEERRWLHSCRADGVAPRSSSSAMRPRAGRGGACGAAWPCSATRWPRRAISRTSVGAVARGRAEHEEGGLRAGAVERVEHRRRVRPGAVVEGERHLPRGRGARAAGSRPARSKRTQKRVQRRARRRGPRRRATAEAAAVLAALHEERAAPRGATTPGQRPRARRRAACRRHGHQPGDTDRAVQPEHLRVDRAARRSAAPCAGRARRTPAARARIAREPRRARAPRRRVSSGGAARPRARASSPRGSRRCRRRASASRPPSPRAA